MNSFNIKSILCNYFIFLISGYETHAVSSFLNWLEDEYVSNFPTNKKPHEYGALCNRLTSKCFISNP